MWLVHMKNDVCSKFGCGCDMAVNVFISWTPTSWMDRWQVYFLNFPFKHSTHQITIPKSHKENFQHVHWAFYAHFQQNFIEMKEKGWDFQSFC